METKDLFIKGLFDKRDSNFTSDFNNLIELGLIKGEKDRELWVMTSVRHDINFLIMNYSQLKELDENCPLTRAELITIYNHMATQILYLKHKGVKYGK